MSELSLRKIKRGISTKRGDQLVQNGQQHPFLDDWEEQQQRYWPSPRAPPVSPSSESPRTPGGSQKKAVLGRVKSKAKKWMHLLHYKKSSSKPAAAHEEMMMWTPRSGPVSCGAPESIGGGGSRVDRQLLLDAYFGIPTSRAVAAAQHPSSSSWGDFERPEVFVDASPRQNSPAPSPTARRISSLEHHHHPSSYFKVSSRFESEMKEANEMLRESKQLRVINTSAKQKTVTFAAAATAQQEPSSSTVPPGTDGSRKKNKELSEPARQVFRNAYEALVQAALVAVARIQEVLVAYSVDGKRVLEKAVAVHRYLRTKLEPGRDERLLSEVITEAFLDLYDAWSENVDRPLAQRARQMSSWFLEEGAGEVAAPPVAPLSTHQPCVDEDAEEFYYSLED